MQLTGANIYLGIMIGNLLENRYRIEAELGQGGMGTVYRAHDTLLDRAVAIKLLNQPTLRPEGRARLLREARAAARLNHPNIVSVYDVVGAEDEAAGLAPPFLVLEFVEGESLFTRPPEAIGDVIRVAQQVCAALDHAHTHGIVHRDLKLENVLLAPDGTVKLTDFGLARSLASRTTGEGAIFGTVFYTAPELAMGQPYDGRADLYALGVLLYELSTRRLPFNDEDPLSIISQHLYAPVVPPRIHNELIPAALDQLIVRLLSKLPEERPATAAEVRDELDRILATLDSLAAPEAAQPSLLERIVRGRMVGRRQEFAQAVGLWRQAMAGAGRVLLVSGEPGIGKTRLVRELIALAEVSGATALFGECYPEGGPPFACIAQMLHTALSRPSPPPAPRDSHTPTEQPALSPLVLADLIQIAPALYARFPDVPSNPPLDPQAEQQRIFESVVEWCASLTSHAPVLLAVDDVHWADSGTLALLQHLARRSRFSKLPLLIVLTYRELELGDSHPLNRVLADFARLRLATRLKLTRLDREQTGNLLAVMLGDSIAPDFVDSIYRETEGNPFFIEELCKSLIEEGQLQLTDGGWRHPGTDEGPLPQSVKVAIQTRVGKLPEQAQEVLRLAAAFGREFEFGLLQRASDLDEEIIIESLEHATRAQLIGEVRGRTRHGRETFSFAHALIPAALRDGVSGLRRHRLHRRAAAAIEAARPDDFEALAYQYAEAADEERAREYYIRAGDRCRAIYCSDAIQYYSEALALLPSEHPRRFDLLASRASMHDFTGQHGEQSADVEAMLALAERLDDDTHRCDALIAQADLYLTTDPLHAHEPAEKAAALAEALGDRVREGRALHRIGWGRHHRSEPVLARQALEIAAARLQEAGEIAEAAACLNRLSLVLVTGLGEKDPAQRAAEEALALSRRSGDRQQEAVSLRRLAIVYGAQQRQSQEMVLIEKSLAINRAIGDRNEERNALNNLGVAYAQRGRRAEAESCLRQSLELAQVMGNWSASVGTIMNLVHFHYFAGMEYERGIEFVAEQEAAVEAAHDVQTAKLLQAHRAYLLGRLGQYLAALALADRVVAARPSFGPTIEAKFVARLGKFQACLGQFAEARRTITGALNMVEGIGAPADLAWKQAALAFVDLIEGERTGAEALFRQGLAQYDRALPILRDRESVEEWINELPWVVRLNLGAGNLQEAMALSEEMIGLRQTVPCVSFPAVFHFSHALVLQRLGRSQEAGTHLTLAYELVMQAASKMKDEAFRRAWLENIYENRETVRYWQAQSTPNSQTRL